MTKRTRKNQVEKEISKIQKDTKIYNDRMGMDNFVLTSSQKECQNQIRSNTLTFVEGFAGTGKSLAILHLFCKEYLKDKSKKIVVIRTPVESAGKDKLGYLPSDLSAKIEPHFASTKYLLTQLLNTGKVEADLEKRIFFKVPNFVLGSTMDDSLILIDEAQMLQPLIMKLLLERIGQNSKVVVAGDGTQVYSQDTDRNGMKDALNRFFDAPGYPSYEDIGYYKFSVEDVQRSAIVKTVIKAYNK